MGLTLVIAAAIPAYLAAGVALLLGSGWLMALGVLMATGVIGTLALAALKVWLASEPAEDGALSPT